MRAETIIAESAAAHGLPAADLAQWMTARGWDWTPLESDPDPAVETFARKIIGGYAESIAKLRRERAEHAAARDAAHEMRRLLRLTQAARQHPGRICGKCDGAGRLDWASHIEFGRCFWCGGTGIIRTRRVVA